MAIPSTAFVIEENLDPFDVLEIDVPLSTQPASDGKAPHLEGGEGVAAFTLARTPEAIACGLVILNGLWSNGFTYPAPQLLQSASGPLVRAWIAIDPLLQSSPIFDGPGQKYSLELSTTSDHSPPRQKQRTVTGSFANR